jgi:pimeloyl-ACP methyl ester carboxylesterase
MPGFRFEGQRIAYGEFGSGPRVVVLIHGLLLSQRRVPRRLLAADAACGATACGTRYSACVIFSGACSVYFVRNARIASNIRSLAVGQPSRWPQAVAATA